MTDHKEQYQSRATWISQHNLDLLDRIGWQLLAQGGLASRAAKINYALNIGLVRLHDDANHKDINDEP